MATCFENISLHRYNDISKQFEILVEKFDLRIEISQKEFILFIKQKTGDIVNLTFDLNKLNSCKLSKCQLLAEVEFCTIDRFEMSAFVLESSESENIDMLIQRLSNSKNIVQRKKEVKDIVTNQFDHRTEKWSATQYFQFYSYLSQQQNMMQDYVRTSTYQRAVLNNVPDFRNKVVLDVGAGSGILSFFAIQAGAKKVYAVEASNMAGFCDQLVQNNNLAGRIIVVSGKIEEVEIPEPVDILISEPMGYMLLNERMLETYIHARKFLRQNIPCMMFPTVADLFVAPFSDEVLYMEVAGKANFWYQQSFHGVDLSSVRELANKENFSQPIVDVFDINICLSPPIAHKIDFRTVSEEDLHMIDVPLKFTFHQTGCCHGLAIWFDVGFLGTQKDVWLSTSPTEPLTHWYQVRCLFLTPLFVYEGQSVIGHLYMNANSRQSYDVEIELSLPGTTCKVKNSLDLKNPYFRYTGQSVQLPPGNHSKAPTESYFSSHNGTATVDANLSTVNGHMISPQKSVMSCSGDSFINQSPSQTSPFGFIPNNQPSSMYCQNKKSDESSDMI